MRESLPKKLGFVSLVTMGVAGIIGSGWIYVTSDFFTQYGAGGVVFGMVLASVIAACIALSYAELSSLFPRTGGEILYTFIAYNKKIAFIIGWFLIGAFISSTAFYMAAFGELLVKGIPVLQIYLENIALYTIAGKTVYLWSLLSGVALVLFFYILNSRSVDVSSKTQTFLFVIKLILGVALASAGILLGKWSNFMPAFYVVEHATTYDNIINSALSTMKFVIPALTFLTGFSVISLLAEEANISPKKIGLAVVVTIFIAGLYYVLVLLGVAMIIPWQESAKLEFGAISTFGVAGYPILSFAAIGIAFLGMGTGSLGMAMGCARIMLAMARGGLLPKPIAVINERGVPMNALTAVLIMTLSFGWLGKAAMIWLLDTGGVFVGLSWAVTVFCMFKIRKLYPNLERPYKVKYSFLTLIGAIGAIGIIIMTLIPNTALSLVFEEYLILGLWCLLGILLYAVVNKKNTLTNDEALANMLGSNYDELKKLKE